MITIFNRKELLITRDFLKQVNVRKMLSDHNIPYEIKITNIRHKGRMGGFGENSKSSCEYKIYVHKNDYDEAVFLNRTGDAP